MTKVDNSALGSYGEYGNPALDDGPCNPEDDASKAIKKPKCKLIGQDGNIFNLMGLASRALKQAGLSEQSKEMCIKVMGEADSYGAALNIIGDYVDIE